MNPPRFFPSHIRNIKLNIPCIFGVVSTFVWSMLPQTQAFFFETKTVIPVESELFPIFKLLHAFGFVWLDIKLQFHLFKLTLSKKEIARSNFISKCFAYLANTKRQFRMH